MLALDAEGVLRAGHTRHDADLAHMRTVLFEALQDAGGPLTRDEWLAAVEGRRQLKLEALRQLTTSGTSIANRVGNQKPSIPIHRGGL